MIFASATAIVLITAGLAAEPTAHDPFTGAVTVLNYSFENDEDLDFRGDPDGWTRRKGPGFPSYVETGIDRTRGRAGNQSLQFLVNGGQAAMYSPPTLIDPLHSYIFRGYIRTEALEHDGALISISFLNHKRQRLQRILARAVVTGTHDDWVRVTIDPVTPRPDARFVVVGCHLVQGEKMDIRGSVWFDDLWLGKLPQLSLVSNFHRQFVQGDAPIQIDPIVSGLDAGRSYRLLLEMKDSDGHLIAREVRSLRATAPAQRESQEPLAVRPESTPWELPPQENGFYQVQAALERDGVVILEKQASFAVMDLVDELRGRGSFGWSVARRADEIPPRKLIEVAKQAGINWLKYPLWQSVYADDRELPARTMDLFDGLIREGVTPVGLLSDPPQELRAKFAKDWAGISEIFTMPLSFWSPSLQPVIARYSSSVRHWQLGGEADMSFVGLQRLPETLSQVKRELDRIGRDTRIGVHWDWNAPLPSGAQMPQTFLSLGDRQVMSSRELIERLKATDASTIPRWVVLKPLSKKDFTPEERGSDLVRRMVAAKIGGAEAIFAYDVFDEQYGLLNTSGSPTRLFLPWRTTALALQQAEYLGSFNMLGGSRNFAFAKGGEVVLVVWNDADQPVAEEMYLGENVIVTDIWGRQRPAERREGKQVLTVGPVPQFVRGCSEPVARWRSAVRFEHGQMRSAYGAHQEAVLGRNTFSQGINGTVSLSVPREWEITPPKWSLNKAAGEKFRQEMLITLPSNASLGTELMAIDFDIFADRHYRFRVHRPYEVGLGDVLVDVIDRKLDDGRLEVEQIITNNISPVEVLNFRCTLFVPGHRRQKRTVTKLGRGQDKKFYHLPDADSLRGQVLRLRAEQVGGARVLNYRWRVGENWNSP